MEIINFLGIVLGAWIILSPICKRIDKLAILLQNSDKRLKKLEECVFCKEEIFLED